MWKHHSQETELSGIINPASITGSSLTLLLGAGGATTYQRPSTDWLGWSNKKGNRMEIQARAHVCKPQDSEIKGLTDRPWPYHGVEVSMLSKWESWCCCISHCLDQFCAWTQPPWPRVWHSSYWHVETDLLALSRKTDAFLPKTELAKLRNENENRSRNS